MIGERIQQARLASGLSLRALAERAGVTAMAISKYENNQSTPSSKVLLAMAQALSVRTEYFFRRKEICLTDINHREHEQLPEKEERKVLADVKEQLERWLVLEEVLPSPWGKSFDLPVELPSQLGAYEEIEKIAIDMRRHWQLGLGPIPDLIDTLESCGIKVLITRYDGHEKFNGLSARMGDAPVVVVGQSWTGDRQRFTLAHELGHLVLHGRLATGLDEEKACHRFAGAFLVPEPKVMDCLGEKRSWLEPQELHLLKHEWGLSMMAWSFRAKDLGIINQQANRQIWTGYMKAWKEAKREPGDEYKAEPPRLFQQGVYRALAEDLISESKAAELLGVSLSEFHATRKMESPHVVGQ